MSYDKHTWVSKEVIKAKNLNHMEDGIYNEEQRATNAENQISQSVTNENTRATNAEGALGNRVSATESAITTLNGSDQVVGSVDYKIAQATVNMGGYKVVADHTAVVNPSDKYIYLEPDAQATGSDVFSEWVWSDFEVPETFAWYCVGETSLDLSDYIKNTDLATTTTPGIVIVDGTTISINNGVITANVQGGVTSFNGRTGAIIPQAGDYTASDVGLGNVGNFKAVSTVASQGLTTTEQTNARANIGAGTSSFSGSYNDLSDKPSIPTATSDLTNDSDFVADASYVHTDENYTSAEKSKLSGIASGAEVNVQSNWNESDNTSDAYIQNKPSIPSKTSDLTNDSGFIDYKAVSTVANQGLSDTEKANARTNIGAGSSSFSGDYNDLSNKPTIPSNTSDLTNDSNFVADASYVHTDNNFTATLKDKLDGIASGAEANVQADWNESDSSSDAYIANKPSLFSGNYNDLSNKPTLGSAAALDVAASGNASSTEVVKGDDTRLTDSRTPTSHTHTTSQITDFPTLGSAATYDVPTTGDASSSQVVKGDDSRLADSRTPTSHTHIVSDITNFPTIPGGVKIGTTKAGATDTTLYFIRS